MKKLTLFMHTSLDGLVAGINGEMDWIRLDEQLFDFVKTFTDRADTALYGRATWQMMEAYWPAAGSKPDASKHDKEHSEWYNKADKIVLSNTLHGQQGKTRFISGDIQKEIQAIKQGQGKDIIIFGSPRAAQSCMRHNLIDEYWLFVNPIILGQGMPLFPRLNAPIPLERKERKEFPCGVTALNYAR